MFFFFKNKTAYEMRISDWSSDVCSSDLETDNGEIAAEPEKARQIGQVVDLGVHHQRTGHLHTRQVHPVAHVVHPIGHALVGLDLLDAAKVLRDQFSRVGIVCPQRHRSEERRGGKEWVRTCRSRWSPDH